MSYKVETIGDFEFTCEGHHSYKDMDGQWKTNPTPEKQSIENTITMHQKALDRR